MQAGLAPRGKNSRRTLGAQRTGSGLYPSPIPSRKEDSTHEGCFPLFPSLPVFVASRRRPPAERPGLGAHRHQHGPDPHPAGRGRLQARRCRSADSGPEGRLRRHPLCRPERRRHLRHGVEEHGSPGHARLAAGTQCGAVGRGSGQRRHGRLRGPLGRQRPRGRLRLALRRQQHCQPAGAGPAIQRGGQRGIGADDRPSFCRRDHSSPGRRHQRHCRDQNLLHQHPFRYQRSLDDGL